MKLFAKLCLYAFTGIACCIRPAQAQLAADPAPPDTLHLTLSQTEAIFLQKNLQLLAQHYNARADSALIRQARLWDNPTLSIDQNVYTDKRFLEHGRDEADNPTRQVYVQVQQLIQLGGKRGRAIAAASANAGVSQLQFEETLRDLRLTLRKDFYTILQLERFANLYRAELLEISKLTAGMNVQFNAGNIARKDLLRVQAVEVGLEQERIENAKALEDVQAELRTLLSLNGTEYIAPDSERLSAVPALPHQSITDLIDLAHQHNPSYRLAAQQVQYQQLNYRYQKALAIPDLNVGPNYDRLSNFTPNYFGLTLGIPIPLLNRNQGNIRAAELNVKQQESLLGSADVTLQNDVRAAYRKLVLALSIVSPQTTQFYNDYRQLFDNIIASYSARQISLLEFIDYLNGYEDIREKQLQQQLNLQLAKEQLNHEIGVDVIR